MARSVLKKKGSSHSKSNGIAALLVKKKRIEQAIQTQDRTALRILGIERGGFLNSDLRRRAWRTLLHLDPNGVVTNRNQSDSDLPMDLTKQVSLDVQRSFSQFKIGPSTKELKTQLQSLVLSVFAKHSYLHYYQGFHDISTVILLTDGSHSNVETLSTTALFWLRDFMEPNLAASMNYLDALSNLIDQVDSDLYRRFQGLDGFQPIFALSWIITWFCHDVDNPRIAQRLFDAFLSTHPTFPIYIAAVLIIKYQPASKPETVDTFDDELDISVVHRHYQSLPEKLTATDWDSLIQSAFRMYETIPHTSLYPFHRGSAAREFDRTVLSHKNTMKSLDEKVAYKAFQIAISRNQPQVQISFLRSTVLALSITAALVAVSWAVFESRIHPRWV